MPHRRSSGGGDAIQITDLAFKGATLAFFGGVLTITNGAKSAAITLTGSFTQSDFHMVASGTGVKITQTGGSLAATLRFAQASSRLGERVGPGGWAIKASPADPLTPLAARA